MNRESLYRPLTIIMPIFAVLCAGGVSAYEFHRLKRLEGETTATESKISQIDRELRSYEAQPQTEKFPTVEKTPREQALFLDALRANADISKVQLIRWSNSTPPAAPPSSADKPASGPASQVTAITSIVEVTGQTENTRRFLYNVIRSRRLLNLSDIKWVRDSWPNTHLTFTLTRYVAPPVPLPMERPHTDHADEDGHVATATHAVMPAPQQAHAPADPANRIVLPNPMDAPGIAHGYQSRLEAGVSQLNDMDQSKSSASPRPPAVTNAKR